MAPRALLFTLLLAAPVTRAAPPPEERPAPLTLEDALQELDAESLTLAEARARAEQAAGLARQALAPALPTLSATGSYTRNSDEARIPLGRLLDAVAPGAAAGMGNLVVQPRQVFSASAGLRLPLVAPSAWQEAASARSAARAAELSVGEVRLSLRAALVATAWNASAGSEVVEASRRALAAAEEQQGLSERSLAAGTGVPLAVLQAKTEAVRKRSDLVRALADRDRAELAAGVLLGRSSPVRIELAPRGAAPPEEVGSLVDEALSQRPELAAARAEVEAAERQLSAARLRLLPQLSATAQVFAQDEPLVTGEETGWRASLELTWALYDGGFRYGRARQARGSIAEARARASRTRLLVAQEVEDAAREVRVAAERLRLSEEQARLAAEAAATARRSFAGGVAGSLEVIDANDRLYAAEMARAQARAGLGASWANLDRATGSP